MARPHIFQCGKIFSIGRRNHKGGSIPHRTRSTFHQYQVQGQTQVLSWWSRCIYQWGAAFTKHPIQKNVHLGRSIKKYLNRLHRSFPDPLVQRQSMHHDYLSLWLQHEPSRSNTKKDKHCIDAYNSIMSWLKISWEQGWPKDNQQRSKRSIQAINWRTLEGTVSTGATKCSPPQHHQAINTNIQVSFPHHPGGGSTRLPIIFMGIVPRKKELTLNLLRQATINPCISA